MNGKINNRANVQCKFDGTKLVIEIETDTDKVDAQPSTSGKTRTVATTGGFVVLQNGQKLNLTLSDPR